MKKLFAVLAIACLAQGVFAEDAETRSGIDAAALISRLQGKSEVSTELSKEAVSPAALQSLLSDKYPENRIDEDGDLFIKRGGINTFVFVEKSQVLLKFYTRWEAAESISDARAIRLANTWNSDKVFAVACYEDGYFILRYFMTYEGGINAANFNDSLDWFFSVSSAFGDKLEEEDAI